MNKRSIAARKRLGSTKEERSKKMAKLAKLKNKKMTPAERKRVMAKVREGKKLKQNGNSN
jgi:hypothetical protein